MNIFKILSAFDWISPAYQTIRDIHHASTDGEPTTDLYIGKLNLGFAQAELKRAGIDVISNSQDGTTPVAGLSIRDSQYSEAWTVLAGCGVEIWQ
jgi:hypothetical protein